MLKFVELQCIELSNAYHVCIVFAHGFRVAMHCVVRVCFIVRFVIHGLTVTRYEVNCQRRNRVED